MDEAENKVGAPTLKGGQAGAYTKEEGIFSFYEICEKINVNKWIKAWDENQQSAYAVLGNQWVGFDNERSIALKVHWALTVMNLGGTMLWTLDFDDYSGQFCEGGQFPLAYAIKSVFDEYEVFDEMTTQTTTSSVAMRTSIFDALDYQFVFEDPDKDLDYIGNQFDRDESTTIANLHRTRIESVLSTMTLTSTSTTTTTTTTSITSKTSGVIPSFYLPKNLNNLKSIEREKLNSVMYEILNVPLVSHSDAFDIASNLSNRSDTDQFLSGTYPANGAGSSILSRLSFLPLFSSLLFCLFL